MSPMSQAQARIQAKRDEIKQRYSESIVDLLKDVNARQLRGKGEITAAPAVERAALRWTLCWSEKEKISFDLNVVVSIEDDGKHAKIGPVWVQRHASTPLDYEDHTPTTRMRRLTELSIEKIHEAIEAEWG